MSEEKSFSVNPTIMTVLDCIHGPVSPGGKPLPFSFSVDVPKLEGILEGIAKGGYTPTYVDKALQVWRGGLSDVNSALSK